MTEAVKSKKLFNYEPLGKLNEEARKMEEEMFKNPAMIENYKKLGEYASKSLDDNEANLEMITGVCRNMCNQGAAVFFQEAHKPFVEACTRTEITVPIRDGNDAEVSVIVYTPKKIASDDNKVAMIYAHGGGAIANCTEDFKGPLCETAVKCGLVMYSVDYRLAPETRAPKNAQDFYCAIKHIEENADSLGIDSSRIAISGDSGGGYICFAAMVMLARKDEGHLVKLAMPGVPMIDDCVSVSFEKRVKQEVENFPFQQRAWKCIAPNFKVDQTDALLFPLIASDEELSKMPPTIIWSKEFDIYISASRMMAEKLEKNGRLLEFVVYPGQTHTSNFISGSKLCEWYMNDYKLALKEYLF